MSAPLWFASDVEVVHWLRDAEVDLSKPRLVTHSFRLPSVGAMQATALGLSSAADEVVTAVDRDAGNFDCVVAAFVTHVVTAAQSEARRWAYTQLATAHGGAYNGWWLSEDENWEQALIAKIGTRSPSARCELPAGFDPLPSDTAADMRTRFQRWEMFVATVERGFDGDIDMFLDECESRAVLERGRQAFHGDGIDELNAIVGILDSRFDGTTEARPVGSTAGMWPWENAWFRVPKRLTGALQAQIADLGWDLFHPD